MPPLPENTPTITVGNRLVVPSTASESPQVPVYISYSVPREAIMDGKWDMYFQFVIHRDSCPVEPRRYYGTATFHTAHIYEIAGFLFAREIHSRGEGNPLSLIHRLMDKYMDVTCPCCEELVSTLEPER